MADKPEVASGMGGLKVIGAGFGRTGTLSLKAALEELGFGPCYHMVELFNKPDDIMQWENAVRGEQIDWNKLFQGYQATVDWPGCSFYEELMNAYPDAKVLLTVRDPERWYESVNSTIYQMRRRSRSFLAPVFFLIMRISASSRPRVSQMINALVWERTFGGHFEDRQHAVAVFNQHVENVKNRVPSDRLLVYEVKEGWTPLCVFLGVKVPVDKPFPHLNDRSNFVGSRIWLWYRGLLVGALLVLIALTTLLFLRRRFRRSGEV